jgi:hypothetical protein
MTISLPKPQHSLGSSQSAHIRKRLPFDGGNRFIKWIAPQGQVRIIPSFIRELEDWEDANWDDKSVVITYEGYRFAIGEVADALGGKPVFSEDKCRWAEVLALCALEPNPGCNSVLVETMPIALPDTRNKQAVEDIKRVEGIKEFVRNGQRIVATVRAVQPVNETEPAFHYALSQGAFRYPDGINGMLDLGGGTGIGRLYAPNKTLIRAADVILPGTYQLAGSIAAALTPQLGYSANLPLIMDAIADGSFQYGTTGIDFTKIFQKSCTAWISNIRTKIKTAWVQQLNDLNEVLIIGGSAHLAEPLCEATKGRFKIAQHPQVISLFGMMEVWS